jgi:hypothetical protein
LEEVGVDAHRWLLADRCEEVPVLDNVILLHLYHLHDMGGGEIFIVRCPGVSRMVSSRQQH